MVDFSFKKYNKDVDNEKQIVIHSIVDDEFLKKFYTLLNIEFKSNRTIFKNNKCWWCSTKYVSVIMKWVFEYYEIYNEAPKQTINEIFTKEKTKHEDVVIKIIEKTLISLNEYKYENTELNIGYLIDSAKQYLKKKSIEIFFDEGKKLIDNDKIDEANELIQIHKEVIKVNSDIINPFSDKEIATYDVKDTENIIFKLKGELGNLIGEFKRGYLVSYTAPEKRGKSYFLQENVISALLNKKRVAWISLEMNENTLKGRLYKALTGLPSDDFYDDDDDDYTGKKKKVKEKFIIYPIADCFANQEDTCKRNIRIGKECVIKGINQKYKFDINNNTHEVCCICRDKKEFKQFYKPTYWYQVHKANKFLDNIAIKKRMKQFKMIYGDNLRIKTFPAFSATYSDILSCIEEMEYTQNFIPDVLVIDYIDILAPESSKLSERGNIDALWKRFKNIATSKNIVVITADQSNKESGKKKIIQVTDVSEDKRKNAHVDIKVALNQTAEEKEDGILRVSILAHRHKNFNPNKQVMVLQCIDLSQTYIDSFDYYESFNGVENK